MTELDLWNVILVFLLSGNGGNYSIGTRYYHCDDDIRDPLLAACQRYAVGACLVSTEDLKRKQERDYGNDVSDVLWWLYNYREALTAPPISELSKFPTFKVCNEGYRTCKGVNDRLINEKALFPFQVHRVDPILDANMPLLAVWDLLVAATNEEDRSQASRRLVLRELKADYPEYYYFPAYIVPFPYWMFASDD